MFDDGITNFDGNVGIKLNLPYGDGHDLNSDVFDVSKIITRSPSTPYASAIRTKNQREGTAAFWTKHGKHFAYSASLLGLISVFLGIEPSLLSLSVDSIVNSPLLLGSLFASVPFFGYCIPECAKRALKKANARVDAIEKKLQESASRLGVLLNALKKNIKNLQFVSGEKVTVKSFGEFVSKKTDIANDFVDEVIAQQRTKVHVYHVYDKAGVRLWLLAAGGSIIYIDSQKPVSKPLPYVYVFDDNTVPSAIKEFVQKTESTELTLPCAGNFADDMKNYVVNLPPKKLSKK